ncbi:hypothetical protein BC832DRAFT_161277 [Gaertneriomyces semiglobifer]|nr:hypothetical protein BC832DRAFT_161277 [Gaertneriomyces semiglobifer]
MISAPLDAEDGLLQHFDLPGFCQTDSPLRQQMNSEDDFPGYHTTTPTMTRHDDSPFFHFTTPSPFNCQRLSPCTCADGSCISCIKRAANANGTDEDAVTPTDEYPHHSGSQVALSSPASSLDILAAAAAESAARKRKISTATGNASPAAESESKRWRSEQESDDWCSMVSCPMRAAQYYDQFEARD